MFRQAHFERIFARADIDKILRLNQHPSRHACHQQIFNNRHCCHGQIKACAKAGALNFLFVHYRYYYANTRKRHHN